MTASTSAKTRISGSATRKILMLSRKACATSREPSLTSCQLKKSCLTASQPGALVTR